MTEQQIADGWKRGSIARILDAMQMYGVTIADLQEADTIQPMVCTTQTPILPAPGYKVAGE